VWVWPVVLHVWVWPVLRHVWVWPVLVHVLMLVACVGVASVVGCVGVASVVAYEGVASVVAYEGVASVVVGVVRSAGGAGEQCGGGHAAAEGGSETSPRGCHQTQLRVLQRPCHLLPQAGETGQLCGQAHQGFHQQVRVHSSW